VGREVVQCSSPFLAQVVGVVFSFAEVANHTEAATTDGYVVSPDVTMDNAVLVEPIKSACLRKSAISVKPIPCAVRCLPNHG